VVKRYAVVEATQKTLSLLDLEGSIVEAPPVLRWLFFCLVVVVGGAFSTTAQAQEKIVLAEELEVRGMDCVPQVTEVETRRPIPIICQTDKEVAGVELRYRFEGAGSKWEKVELKQEEAGWTGTIPCAATATKGNLKVYVFARNEARKVVARMGRNTAPMNIKLVESSQLPPPALPNKEPPDRCFSKSECPAEMIGTAVCPGTVKGKGPKGAWGAGCSESSQCQSGLACIGGSCETAPKCETAEDCPSGGECSDGTCHYPTAEELASRLGPPKKHWVGLHFGVDLSMTREATGVCGGDTEDSKDYACYKGGNVYTGIPNDVNAGNIASGLHLATLRALLSYDFVFKRFMFGARLGWAFRGSPGDFSPIHVEARALYSLRQDPENNRFRPYLGLAAGYAHVDTMIGTKIVDCVAPPGVSDPDMIDAAVADCKNDTIQSDIDAKIAGGAAVERELDAYHQGGAIFFGPTFTVMHMFSNESAVVFNLNVMLPNVVFQPSIGYAMGI
jgi:hypothetical protein